MFLPIPVKMKIIILRQKEHKGVTLLVLAVFFDFNQH